MTAKGAASAKYDPVARRGRYLARRSAHLKQDRVYRLSQPERYMLIKAKQRATKQHLPFALTLADIAIPVLCPCFGITLIRGVGCSHDWSPTLDRIVPSRGYVPGNIQVISSKANAMKSNATWEELKRFTTWAIELMATHQEAA